MGATVDQKKMAASPRSGGLKKFFRRNSRSIPPVSEPADEEAAPPPRTKSRLRTFLSRPASRGKPEEETEETTEELPTIVLHQNEIDVVPSPKSSPKRELFQWQDAVMEQERQATVREKQNLKERDGFCRRVSGYDGQVISVGGEEVYELGNYLGGGVAGVVYEGHRLRPIEDYPVRLGQDDVEDKELAKLEPPIDRITVNFLCMTSDPDQAIVETPEPMPMEDRVHSLLSEGDGSGRTARTWQRAEPEDTMALEAIASKVLIDTVDAPSRSKHYAKAVSMHADHDFPSDASFAGMMEETVAIKVLNPVGFRTLSVEVTSTAVVARAGEKLTEAQHAGREPMEEKHVWWLVNPNSRNLRTLQRYSGEGNSASRRVEVDRGSKEKGLRISLIAAYQDREGRLHELPLTRCIEIWGHVPFGASDAEFKSIMTAIDRINQGLPPPAIPAFVAGGIFGDDAPPGRVGTGASSLSGGSSSVEDNLKSSMPFSAKRTGIYRAASTERKTVFCEELKAYIALPAVPSKYLKWLRQRRAATKEIRNMMLIGRHRNVVHLFEVLEYIQETKSTMFLILELVRGGELFDLISSNTARISSSDKIPPGYTESETVMRKFFAELASGIHYCHNNGIAHRDLKPENLLVHNSQSGECTLKIADFGLSAAFGPNSQSQSDQDTVVESLAPGMSLATGRYDSDVSMASVAPPGNAPVSPLGSPMKDQVDKLFAAGGSALSFLTCGAVEDLINCRPREIPFDSAPSPLKRMTSVVGSPHYVAPEIIMQHESKRGKKNDTEQYRLGYDGTKADVWSAGVILYAMLFRSLPFGEDLLRCPRYQSFKKWYDEVKKVKCRRSHPMAALDPVITEVDERDFLGPHWFFPSQSSPESRDLILYMLDPDPDSRPTVQMVLQHPWLLKQG